ncbi:paraquat-inducible protein A [Caulobacter sp. S45]|uniref:paraquat-inducible protein A n=1 Tax=Caulobacter sp. S45 TaxID=1641861 RepID=UPI00131C379B|nr:paraquat-inducible protein A [Caulobacter sp. S45]
MTVACLACGTVQDTPPVPTASESSCYVCTSQIQRTAWRSRTWALGVAWTGLILMAAANLLPLADVNLLGVIRRSYLASGPATIWNEGIPSISLVLGLVVVVLPLARFVLLILALQMAGGAGRPRWLGPVFRWALELETWAMPDVAVLGFWVALSRLAALFPLTLGPGAYALMGAGLASLLGRALLDKREVWQDIAPDRPDPGGETVSCGTCDLLLPASAAGEPCPRCGARLERRKRDALARTAALVLAGVVLYPLANLFPTFTIVQFGVGTSYTILGGAIEIAKAHLVGLAILVVVASFVIPILKLLSLGWFLISIRRGSPRRLRTKTRVYRIVDEIGRWSMVDPLTICFLLPLLHYGSLTSSRPEVGAAFFTGVVVVTMLATRAFDPRLMWDAAQGRAV